MTIRRGFINHSLAESAPEGLSDDLDYVSSDDVSKASLRKGLSEGVFAESRWLARRTDGHMATSPFAGRVREITDTLNPGWLNPSGDLKTLTDGIVFEGTLTSLASKVVETGEVPGLKSPEEDQIEDWLTYVALKSIRERS